MNLRKVFSYVFFIMISTSSLYSQHAPGVKWKQRSTEHFLIIYPQSLSNDAAALSLVLDEVFNTLSSDIPSIRKKKKWPIVLTDLGLIVNGYVSLMPRKSVWYATPGEDFTAVSDWWMLLAYHEGRHMTQFDAADQGFTRFLHILFGELGWGIGLFAGTPTWLIEGDAVYSETQYTKEGRGRDPLFMQEMALLAKENPKASYHKIANPSYKNHHPNIYHVGYALISWIRKQYGDDAMKEIYRRTARIGLPIIGLDVGTIKATGKHPREIFGEMLQDLSKKSQSFQKSITWTEGERVSPPNKEFTRYDILLVEPSSEGDNVFARRTTQGTTSTLVRIGTNGNEEEIIRLPKNGRVSISPLERTKGYRLVWDALRHNPMYAGVSVSDITVTDIDMKGRIKKRYHPSKKSRYLYPAVSPDATRIAVVNMERGEKTYLLILDAETGETLQELPLKNATAAHPSWSANGKKLVFSVRSNGGRRIAEWNIGSDTIQWLTPLSWETVKKPVYTPDGSEVLYSANTGKLESLWSVDVDTKTIRNVGKRWYSATEPRLSPNKQWLYLVEYASIKGENVARVAWNPPANKENSNREETQARTHPPSEFRNPENLEQMIAKGNTEYPEEPWKLTADMIRIHSWGLSIDAVFENVLKLNVQSRDILDTFQWEAGALYDTNEKSTGAYANLVFKGIRPAIFIDTSYKYRNITSEPFHHVETNAGLYFPMNLSRNGIWKHSLTLRSAAGIQYSQEESPPDAVRANASYELVWTHLRFGSRRAFQAEWGWKFKSDYIHYISEQNPGDALAAQLSLFWPGGFRNTFLKFRGGMERRTGDFTSYLGTARGYSWENPGLSLLASVDYDFPLLYPDLPVGALLYIQRIRVNLHSDFAWIGDADVIWDGSDLRKRWSTGAGISFDFAAFNSFSGLSLGLALNWLHETNQFVFNLQMGGLPIY